jgi:hypothetical protein
MFFTNGGTIYTKDELVKMMSDSVEWYENRADTLAEQNLQLKLNAIDVVRKDYEDHIKYLQSRLDMSYGEFSSQKEKDAYNDFEQRHMHERLTMKSQGGKAPYLIPTGTGIGTHLEVVCPICGAKEDITDLEVW